MIKQFKLPIYTCILFFLSLAHADSLDVIRNAADRSVTQTCSSLAYLECTQTDKEMCEASLKSYIDSCVTTLSIPVPSDMNSVEGVNFMVNLSDCMVLFHLKESIERTGNENLCQ